MTDNPNRIPEHGDGPGAPPPRDPTEDIRQLTPAEERDLHFNGFPPYDLRPLHELCPAGGCQHKTLTENLADLDQLIAQDRQPAHDDPEAGT